MQPAPVPVQILTAENAYPDVLDDVGCNARLDGNGDFIINIVNEYRRSANDARCSEWHRF